MSKRVLAAMVAVCAWGATAMAQSGPPIRLGVLTDMSGVNADLGGPGSVEAARLAIEEMGGTVLGRPIELVVADHQNKPDVATTIAKQWYERDGVDVILDTLNTTVSLAVQNVSRVDHKLLLITGSAGDSLVEQDCSRYSVQWVFNTTAMVQSSMEALVAQGNDSWFIVSADYSYGHQVVDYVEAHLPALGGRVVGKVYYPASENDFTAYLLQASASKAKLVVNPFSNAATISYMKQADEMGMQRQGQNVTLLFPIINFIHSMGPDLAHDKIFVAAFYWDRDEASRAFAKRFFARRNAQPGDLQAGVYSAALQYLRAVASVGSTDADLVRAKLGDTPINDGFAQNGRIMANGSLVHDLFLVRVKKASESRYPWDYYEILSTIPAAKAFKPQGEVNCPLLR